MIGTHSDHDNKLFPKYTFDNENVRTKVYKRVSVFMMFKIINILIALNQLIICHYLHTCTDSIF